MVLNILCHRKRFYEHYSLIFYKNINLILSISPTFRGSFWEERASDHPTSNCQQAQVCPHSPLQAPRPPAGPALQGQVPQESTRQDKPHEHLGMCGTPSTGQRPGVCGALTADTGGMRTDSRKRAESPTFHLSVCEKVPSCIPSLCLRSRLEQRVQSSRYKVNLPNTKCSHAFRGEIKCNLGYRGRNFNDLERCSQYFV